MTKEAQITITREVLDDDSPDASYLEQEDMGFEDRLEAYRNGEFSFVGVRAVAEIKVPYGKDWIVTKLESPGLWGIESDSSEDYFNSVFEDEKATLLDMLASLRDFELAA